MRNRLVERLTKSKKGSLGYTMTELLVVIGIIAVLCAIAIPGIIYIRNSLRFAQANNYAKSIFLAAQQNLTELRSDGGLGPVQDASNDLIPLQVTDFPNEFRGEYYYTTTGTEAFSRVLPTGSIDADIRDDQIVIEYNPITGNVYSVFYFERGIVSSGFNLADQYSGGALPREKESRRELMVGYYDGSGLNSSQIELEQTQAMVEFINGQEGMIQVKVPMPESFYGDFGSFAEALDVDLTITGEYSITKAAELNLGVEPMPLRIKSAGNTNGCRLDTDGKTVIIEYAIDSLANRSSFVNYISDTQKARPGEEVGTDKSLTTLLDEAEFHYTVLPGENITIQADVTFQGNGQELVQVSPGILSGVNPMFESLQPGTTAGRYVLTISNGRNLQNLNAISPTIATQIESVVIVKDIDWNDTVNYYNDNYGTVQGDYKVFTSNIDEAPARRLPYFVPIHSAALFGTAKFDYGVQSWASNLEDGIIKDILTSIFDSNSRVPTLTDEFDVAQHAAILGSDAEHNDGVQIRNLNIDSTKNPVGKAFYAGTADADIDRFTGLFSYANTTIDGIYVVNPIIKGYKFVGNNNPATGSLLGAGGYNTLITNCAAYLDTSDPSYSHAKMAGQAPYNADSNSNQNWYGVSGEGAVGGLVGYAKSHRTTTGALDPEKPVLSFRNSFAAVNVSGNMRTAEKKKTLDNWIGYFGYKNKDFGYSNGIGGFIGNSQLTNCYNCYASGNVQAYNTNVAETFGSLLSDFGNSLMELFGKKLEVTYGGRESAGAGGFVGTSHGTRYTNCFSSGNVTASKSPSDMGAGGFAGIVCIDETFAYGNQNDDAITYATVAQRTVITNCYSVGLVTMEGNKSESFSGANARNATGILSLLQPSNINELASALVADYYRLLAPHYKYAGSAPSYEDFYIYKDSYYLSQYYDGAQENSNSCASPAPYSLLQNLPGHHQDNTWINQQIEAVKKYRIGITSLSSYENRYFDRDGNLEQHYKTAYKQGFASGWNSATASTTHAYDLIGGTYPFSKINGLDYYGDWPSRPLDYGVAYYEMYHSTGDLKHYHFDKESSSQLLSDVNTVVTKDGYAIMSASDKQITITVNGKSKTFNNGQPDDKFDDLTSSYHVYILTDAQMNAAVDYVRRTGQFYVPIKVTQDNTTNTFYFNPVVARSQVNGSYNHTYIDSDSNSKCDSCRNAADHEYHLPFSNNLSIRSARQIAALGTMSNYFGSEFRYVQQLNIDASKYKWNQDSGKQFKSIGTKETPFDATYTGYYIDDRTIMDARYSISGFHIPASGIFGCIGEKGSVSDLIVDCDNVIAAENLDNAGVLAGVNNGTLDNITLNLKKDVTLSAKTNAGLLAGLSGGTVSNCTVTAEEDVKLNAVNAGALIGSASGSADRRTAVTDCVLTLDETLKIESATYAGGLIGEAKFATVTNSTVSIKKLDSQAEYAGGLVGYAEDSFLTGSSAGNITEVSIDDSLTARGTAAGVIASGKNTTLSGIDLSAKSISGNIAAGFLGTGENVDPTNCTVRISRNIEGRTAAAGAACTIGSGSVFNQIRVDLTNAEISASEGNAAGFALEIKPEAIAMGQSSVTLNDTTIKASDGNAAGFACTIEGSAGDVRVVGKGEITGANAAGFACTITGAVETAHVSPALNANNYKGNRNRNLTVEGSDSAAGFVLTVGEKGVVSNCYTLCEIKSSGEIQIEKDARTAESSAPTEPEMESVSSTYGFVGTNNGTINRCMANVDLTKGFAFAGINNKLISSCYGWYGDQTDRNPTKVRAEMVDNGICNSSYFVEIDPEDRAGQCATVYHADGTIEQMTSSMLQNVQLTGFVTGYNEYPYSEMYPTDYPYPMLRDHYGDWLLPPQYAYGVAYYETYANGTTKLHMVDLSDKTLTVENEKEIPVSRNGGFNNDGTIIETGYAMFYNTLVGMDEAEKLFSYTVSDGYTYDFYAIEANGTHTIPKTTEHSTTATINTWFADAINVTDYYEIRTPEQLANIGKLSANYVQTHDIATTDVTTATIEQDMTYNGNGLTLRITGQTATWLSDVSGTVQNLKLAVTDAVNAPIFGTVSGTVNLNGVNLASIAQDGALVSTANGTVNTGSITVGAMNGHLFDTISGATVTTGEINLTSRTASMVGVFDSGTLQGDSQDMKSISLPADVQAPLFSANVGGTVRNYSYTTGTMLGGLADTVDVDGELSSLTVTANDTAAAFVTELNGTMKDVKLNVTGSLNTSAIGTNTTELSNIILTAESATVSGGVLVGSNAGSITGCTVDVNTVNAQGAVFGVVADRLYSGKTLTATVLVDDLIYSPQTDASVGGLVGTNAGKVTGSTVTILATQPATVEEPEEEITEPIEDEPTDPTEETGETLPAEPIAEKLPQGVKLSGVKDFTLTFGGLTGTNSGAIESSKANVNVTYVQSKETTDKAILGGLVGTMQGGTLTGAGADDATGSITLTGNAKGRAYVVGGAVGSDLGATYTNVAVTTLIGENWAGASVLPNAENPMATGPIGMFTGYVTTGNYNTCASTAPNSTYQFLGQILITEVNLPNSGDRDWFGHSNSTEDNTYPSTADETIISAGKEHSFIHYNDGHAYTDFATELNCCTFIFKDRTYTQTYRATEYFYLGHKLTHDSGYLPVELTNGSPFDNYGSKFVITDESAKYFFNGSSTGTLVPELNSKGYYSEATYRSFVQWETEQTKNYFSKQNQMKYNGKYLYLNEFIGKFFTTDLSTTVTEGLKVKKVTNGFTIYGQSRYLVPTSSGFDLSKNSATLKLWYFEFVPASYECIFGYQNFFSETCVAVNGNEILQPNT